MADTLDDLVEKCKGTPSEITHPAYSCADSITDEYEWFPVKPQFIPDGEGGLDIEWHRGSKQVSVSCRAQTEEEVYVYYQWGEETGTLDYTPDNLKDRLQWLMRNEPST